MSGIHLVMPMAGHGSRFSKAGFDRPKPMLTLHQQPLFWWAVESVRRSIPLRSLTFVILREHVERHRIDRQIREHYPNAALIALREPTVGALVTAMEGCRDVPVTGPVIFNDCDHAFDARNLAAAAPQLGATDGLLCHFHSQNPAYSYAAYSPSGRLERTVEKQVISDLAIAGAYGFRDRGTFMHHAANYLAVCPYDEPFMSGVYNTIVAAGGEVRGVMLERHVSFGTPAEFAAAPAQLEAFRDWTLTETVR